MRDRSRMSPEAALFGSDERTLEQRYEDVRCERDELEVMVQDLTELLSGYLLRGEDPWDLLLRFNDVAQNGKSKPQQRAARTREVNRATRKSVVYYLAMNGRVKIGFSSSFVGRMQALHAQRADILAIEPGGSEIEHARHKQFAKERVERTELFARSAALSEHIATLRAQHPDPWVSAIEINGLTT